MSARVLDQAGDNEIRQCRHAARLARTTGRVANATVLLASEAASLTTGTLVPVDGGTSA